MKKGKTSKLNIFGDAKCQYGTVDSKNLKSIYIILQTWIEPNDDYENWSKLTGDLKRNILHTLLEVIDRTIFEKKFIVDLDLRTPELIDYFLIYHFYITNLMLLVLRRPLCLHIVPWKAQIY